MEEDFSAKRPDLGAIEEFKRKESVYLERVSELDQITAKKEQQRKRHEDLRYSLFKGCLVLTNSFLKRYEIPTPQISGNTLNLYLSFNNFCYYIQENAIE